MRQSGPIQDHYIDALGRRHAASRTATNAVRAAMTVRDEATDSSNPVVVHTQGAPLETGPAELGLEGGGVLTVDRALPLDLPSGYHTIRRRGERADARLIVAPRRCFLPETYQVWGWAIQLYASRSRRSWGIGDLADLRRLNVWAAQAGAGLALVNPLASAAPIVPQEPSPYFPTSRRFRNPLYLSIEHVPGAREVDGVAELGRRARALNRDRLIDRDQVYRLKLRALELIWEGARGLSDASFNDYLRDMGAPLVEYATFCWLAERFHSGWRSWPEGYRRPSSPSVRRAASDAAAADRIRFHAWLQYQIDRQLRAATRTLPIMQDLPIGFDPDGADAWAFQDALAHGVSVGAPPDEFNTKGQNWGLPPFAPQKLRAERYEPFIQTIRACLQHAGGLRIDHVMGLFRLFWIPSGMEPKDGVYVRNEADELLAIVALESQRARAVIVGEDLGTVEKGIPERLMERSILSYRLVWFENVHPRKFPEQALAAITTHDLPTTAGLWTGSDLDAQKRLRLAPNEQGTREIRHRVRRMTRATSSTPAPAVIVRLYTALASAPSRIVTATLDDALAVEERPNMPASGDGWPNWSLALPQPIETLIKTPLARQIAKALSASRQKPH
jgi:4-alpha-glucanotransferase